MNFRASTSRLGDDAHENELPGEIEDLPLVSQTFRLLKQRATHFLHQLELCLSAVASASRFPGGHLVSD